ncbi:aspartic peptidase domain-containing protein, partial [Piptocephalis cylindrospora]
LINEANVDYFATAWVGTPRRPFRLLVDTGSADIWIPGIYAPDHAHYTLANTSTAMSPLSSGSGARQSLRYGSGQVDGFQMTDLISFDSIGSASRVRHPFLVATQTTDFFNHVSYDGLLGLAFSGASALRPASPSLVKALVEAKVIDHAVFSVRYNYMDRIGPLQKRGGELILGGWDPRINSIRWVSVSRPKSSLWDLDLLAFQATGGSSGTTSALAFGLGHIRVVLDTGTSLAVLPLQDAVRVNEVIGATISSREPGVWMLPCALDSLPDLQIVLSGQAFTLHPKDYVFNPGNDQCISAFLGNPGLALGRWILGDMWFRAYHTIFDMDRSLIGFGP